MFTKTKQKVYKRDMFTKQNNNNKNCLETSYIYKTKKQMFTDKLCLQKTKQSKC